MDTGRDSSRVARVWRAAETATLVLAVSALAAVVALVATHHPHRAVLVLVATLFAGAGLRAVWRPGARPWFASRHRWTDVAFYAAVGAAIWYLSPYTATMGLP